MSFQITYGQGIIASFISAITVIVAFYLTKKYRRRRNFREPKVFSEEGYKNYPHHLEKLK